MNHISYVFFTNFIKSVAYPSMAITDCKILYYIFRFADADITLEILSLGAYLGAENEWGETPIQHIEYETLKAHLDNCVIFDLSMPRHDKEFCIEFDVQSLVTFSLPFKKDPEIFVSGETLSKKKIVPDTEVKTAKRYDIVMYIKFQYICTEFILGNI